VALLAQRSAQHVGDRLVVLDDEHAPRLIVRGEHRHKGRGVRARALEVLAVVYASAGVRAWASKFMPAGGPPPQPSLK
jgi:hypothetical protein